MKKFCKIFGVTLLFVLACALIYILALILPYRKQPEVSMEYKNQFQVEDCYADTVSGERAYIIDDNHDALLTRMQMIEQAKERVILSSFDFRPDESGLDMIAMLKAAGERGVKVQIIVDGMSVHNYMIKSPYVQALANTKNVEMKVYNVLNLFKPWTMMGRLHDKYVIADDNLYVLGGRNTDDFFLATNEDQKFDRDVLVYNTDQKNKEASVYDLVGHFDEVWALKESTPLKKWQAEKTVSAAQELTQRYEKIKARYPHICEEADYVSRTFEVNKITLLTSPVHLGSKEPTLFYALTEIMKQGAGDVVIHTPYIICNRWMYDTFAELCQLKPRTELLTNSAANNVNLWGAVDYLLHKKELVATGLNLYEFEGGKSYHGKSIAVGDRLAMIGSFNMDMRSVYVNTELMAVIDSPEVNQQLRNTMNEYKAYSVHVIDNEHSEVPDNVTPQKIGPWRHLLYQFLKIFNVFRFLM